MFSVAQLLLPISPTQACGADLSFSPELDAIAKARMYDDPTLDQGEWVVALKEADWDFVAARCARLLESRSKDLRLAVWLAEAHARTRSFRGLGDGYALLAGLCEHYWDGLYPAADEGEFEQRIGNLHWLLARTPQLVKDMPVTAGVPYSLSDFEAARLRAASSSSADTSNQPWASEPLDTGMALAELEAERRRNPVAFNAALLADAEYCLAMLGELERVVDQRLGHDGPAFGAPRESLQAAIHVLAPLSGRAALLEAGAALADKLAGDGASAMVHATVTGAGPLHNRAQALAQLRLVADFFRRTEPHSPVTYLVERAASWGDMALHEWLRAVVKDPAALAGLNELLGVCQQG
ncbi:MAG: type VI secretion system protein TssA [Sphingomonadaceae bacterium]